MPKVAIVMGSDSDLPVMKEAAVVLDELGVPFEFRIISAHRTPRIALDFAASAAERGIGVIIAGAGAAAHLAGVLAAATTLPVIAVPIASGQLGGVDALLAMVQMPAGVPVATVAIGGARNAGILSAQMLALSDSGLADRLGALKERMAKAVEQKDRKLRDDGWQAYRS